MKQLLAAVIIVCTGCANALTMDEIANDPPGWLIFVVVAGLVVGATAIYLLPTIIAVRKDHHNKVIIALINILLGGTLLGWIIALVWSMKGSGKERTGRTMEYREPRWNGDSPVR